MANILQMTFQMRLLNEKFYSLIQISLKSVPMVQFTWAWVKLIFRQVKHLQSY